MIPFFAPLASALVLAGLVRSQPPIQQLQWGLPDFVPDAEYLAATLAMDTVNADSDPCLANEGCLSGTGVRRVLRFGTKIHNYGTSDAHLGLPPDDTTNTTIPYWHFDTCHNHWHFTAYAHYSLVPPVGATPLAGAVTLPTVHGRKSGFCLEDAECPDGLDMRYHCGDQGITRGCADVYGANLPCQWIDVTGLMASPAFNSSDVYTLRVVVNGDGFFPETRGDNNVAEAKVVFDNLGEYEHHHHYHHEVEEAAQVSQVMGEKGGETVQVVPPVPVGIAPAAPVDPVMPGRGRDPDRRHRDHSGDYDRDGHRYDHHGGRDGDRHGNRDGERDGGRYGGRDGSRHGGRDGDRDGDRDGGRYGGRDDDRDGGRSGG